MSFPAHAARHHPAQARYRVSNWSAYDQALQERGSLTFWVTPEAMAAWRWCTNPYKGIFVRMRKAGSGEIHSPDKLMPYPVNEAQRHKIPKARYRVKNWGEYDQALQERGSLTLWVTPEAIAAWHPLPTGRRGRARRYSDLAIETGPLLRLAFGRPGRQMEGLLRSISTLLGLSLAVPDHPTFSRRSVGLSLPTLLSRNTEPVHVVIDATGLKVYGAGEWQAEKHRGEHAKLWGG